MLSSNSCGANSDTYIKHKHRIHNMKLNKIRAEAHIRKGFTLVELLVVIAIIATLAGLSYGPIMKQLTAAERIDAITNGRSINTALLSFFAANDSNFPNGTTSRGGDITAPESLFQQLFDSDFVDDEEYFWNRRNARLGAADINKPNNDGTLDADELVWGYVMNVDITKGDQPLFFDSAITATNTSGSFSTLTWGGKAIIGRVDGSVTATQITFVGLADQQGRGQAGPIVEGTPAVDIFSRLTTTAVVLPTNPSSTVR